MKVSELIELLQKMPQDMEVETEGCDCTAPAGRPEVWPNGGDPTVMITRHSGGEPQYPTATKQKPSLEDLEREYLE